MPNHLEKVLQFYWSNVLWFFFFYFAYSQIYKGNLHKFYKASCVENNWCFNWKYIFIKLSILYLTISYFYNLTLVQSILIVTCTVHKIIQSKAQSFIKKLVFLYTLYFFSWLFIFLMIKVSYFNLSLPIFLKHYCYF
jgi:hypothetical protein